MVYSWYKKQRIIYFHGLGYRAPTICQLLQEESLKATRQGIAKVIKKFEETHSLARTPGSGRPSKITDAVKALVERRMREDDETTAHQIHFLLTSQGYRISCSTVLCCRTSLGWTFRGSSYCQLIREANKAKRLSWAQHHLQDTFDDVVWTDECSVQLETHERFCCRKNGEPPRLKPR